MRGMSVVRASTRPIGWWLKEADSRLDAAFDSALEGTYVDRRSWQVLASLSRGSTRRVELVTTLASFDPPAVVEEVVARLSSRGWIEESADLVPADSGGCQAARPPGPAGRQRAAAGGCCFAAGRVHRAHRSPLAPGHGAPPTT